MNITEKMLEAGIEMLKHELDWDFQGAFHESLVGKIYTAMRKLEPEFKGTGEWQLVPPLKDAEIKGNELISPSGDRVTLTIMGGGSK